MIWCGIREMLRTATPCRCMKFDARHVEAAFAVHETDDPVWVEHT